MDKARKAKCEEAAAMTPLQAVPDPAPSWPCLSEFQLLGMAFKIPPLTVCELETTAYETTEDGGKLDFLHTRKQIDMLVVASDAIVSGQELHSNCVINIPPSDPITRSKTVIDLPTHFSAVACFQFFAHLS